MGRRSLHSPEELRGMILSSSREIVGLDGMKGLSARAIAKKIGYSPGTLYNVFRNLDDLLVTIQVALVEEAIASLRAVSREPHGKDYVRALGRCYIEFALKNRRLWNLLFQHAAPSGGDILSRNLATLAQIFEDSVRPLMKGRSEEDINHLTKAIWFGLHGMSGMAVGDYLEETTPENMAAYSATLVEGVLALANMQT